jgi:hypothetical protein
MLIRFTMPCVLGTTEYASGDEADLPPDMANVALSLGRGVRVMPDAEPAPAAPQADPQPDPQPAPEPQPPAADPGPVEGARPKRR